ncbi:hypothetical protein, partial [Bosea sp. MMO-172]|uniref:hypothetical protein n=1 Tax=Bosea sp. MMO-172 TaxID=3127885 RepID=UPI003016F410
RPSETRTDSLTETGSRGSKLDADPPPQGVKLARRNTGLNAIRGFEGEKRSIRALTSRKLRATFVTNGIEFFDDKDGMGLRKKPNIDEYIRNEELYASHFKPFYRSVRINKGLLESYI